MSAASDITLFLIILQAMIGGLNASGLFDHDYIATMNNSVNEYTITSTATEKVKEVTNNASIYTKAVDITSSYLNLAWEATFFAIKIVFAVLFVLPSLMNTFLIPVWIALPIQAGIWYVYIMWYAQWKSGKGAKMYE